VTSQPDIAQACEHEVPPATGTYRQDSGQDGCKQFHTASRSTNDEGLGRRSLGPDSDPEESDSLRGDEYASL